MKQQKENFVIQLSIIKNFNLYRLEKKKEKKKMTALLFSIYLTISQFTVAYTYKCTHAHAHTQ